MISANSFWIRLAEVLSCLALNDLDIRSLFFLSVAAADCAEPLAVPFELEPADADEFTDAIAIYY